MKKFLTGLITLSLLFSFGLTPSVVAQSSTSSSSEEDDGNVSLDFRDADIRNVLKVLSFKSGTNIVVGPEVVGLVTIELRDVPWQTALDVILETYGYGYERQGNIITVTTIENLKQRREDRQVLAEQEPLVTRTFILNYGVASEIIASIDRMRTPRGSINFDQRTNSIIVTDIQSNMGTIEEVIEMLDQVTPQVLIEARIIETKLDNTENMGIDWTIQATVTGASRPHIWPFTTSTDQKFLDQDDFPAAATTDFTFGTINANQAQAVLNVLSTRTDTDILSNPSIVTLDNQAASIVVGSQYPIPQYTYNEEQATLQVSGWEYLDIGIIFDVTPHVNNAGMVTLDLQPRVTEISGTATVEDTSLPILRAESASTSVMIKDGDTLVIAGLIKEKTTDTNEKVPILGDLPFIGTVFSRKNFVKEKTELLIFLTPHIITPDDSTT